MYKNVFQAKGMEIVFVSSDKDDQSFKDYFGEQPWAALPYGMRDLKNTLSKKFKVNGIPSLVILGADGNTITTEGREAVSRDPTGAKYPWTPPTPAEKAKAILDALGTELLAKTAGKPIGLYFSAHWCPPCRGFTPKLSEYYNNGLKEKMEIIFVSSDRDKGKFDEYCAEMPWLALPFEKRDEKTMLSEAFGVNGIPSFVVVNPDGTTITTDGRSQVTKDPTGQNFPADWLPQPFNDVNDDPSDLNEEQCVIALGGSESACAAVREVANEYYNAANKDISSMPMRFFTAPAGGVTDQLRKLTGLQGDKLLLLDIPSDGAFYVCEKQEISTSTAKEFISGVLAGKIERKQLER